ncbi:MAG: fumarylacetoacetate hydrolase family protein [Pyrinomonadaceae bacterium]|nr:fumarylacetoacetate hydrolase family protein [Pyrinomonadaceae bacterium]
MKICRFRRNGVTHIGVVDGDRVHLFGEDLDDRFESFGFDEIEFLPPVAPSKIVCVGRNYSEHAKELGNEVPTEPLLFLKAPSSIVNHGDDIIIPPQSDQVEHEGELAVVISKKCKGLTDADNPLDYVFGYTCLNDVTARDLQRKDGQFTRAKSFDTFCPVGPFIETDLDPTDLQVTTRVNSEIRQQGRTSQMVFPVEFLIRYISNMMTLNAGDVIATGTPSGVSKMNTGDVCEVEIEGIGILRNSLA